jgi:hypothetical protein
LNALISDSSTPAPLGDTPKLNKFASQEATSRRDTGPGANTHSMGNVSNSIGRMSFGRSKKQKARNSQNIFNNPAKAPSGKKDYTAGLMAIEEKLRPKDKPKRTLYTGPTNAKNARNAKKDAKTSRMSDLKAARMARNAKKAATSKKTVDSRLKNRKTRNERLE